MLAIWVQALRCSFSATSAMPWVWTGDAKGYGKGGGYGKGWGKGGGGGGGGGGQSKPQALPADFVVDGEKTFKGTVSAYYKFNGYGFITPDDKDSLPGEKGVFVHWKSIVTNDRYPSLTKDMAVTYGKGGGWGKGGGGGGGGGQSKPQALPADFVVDGEKTFKGTCSAYYKFNGYGFVTPDEKDALPSEKVFVHWKNIVTNDRYPSLTKDLAVTFKVQKVEMQGVGTLQATNICGLNGEPISVQDDPDDKNTVVGDKNLRYTGTLKFFAPKRGYGYIRIDPGYQYDKEGVP
eukprot:CAMPEP_0195160180 /NCGR_PEP_ID=MMETSP0448-20130528/186537_1 /TAXON_ID=66468 /ORGANISM="Heterocapsa triquestra, Strain CCMP 448" /LENGTH=290 /DNA_ID=CAMNT_0040198981 /DNA_START=18 /DNA_END=886 /DNA_ORIENTATION=-